jgi:cytochrome bd-type quinol oxidase subunit 2
MLPGRPILDYQAPRRPDRAYRRAAWVIAPLCGLLGVTIFRFIIAQGLRHNSGGENLSTMLLALAAAPLALAGTCVLFAISWRDNRVASGFLFVATCGLVVLTLVRIMQAQI